VNAWKAGPPRWMLILAAAAALWALGGCSSAGERRPDSENASASAESRTAPGSKTAAGAEAETDGGGPENAPAEPAAESAPQESGTADAAPREEVKKGTLNFFEEEERTPLGVWWWGTRHLADEEAFERRLQFLKAHKVTEVYLTYDARLDDAVYRNAIRRLNGIGIRTSALDGDAFWVTESGYPAFEKRLEALRAYQENAAGDERFAGLHLDVEPYTMPEFQADPAPYLPYYMKLVDTAAEFAQNHGMTAEFDIPFWIDEKVRVTAGGEEMLMTEYLIRKADAVNVMSYRDTALRQYLDSMNVIDLVKKHGKKIMMGFETQPLDETPYVTYFEEGPEYMAAEMSKLRSLLKDSLNIPFGLAVHHLDSWIDWPETSGSDPEKS